MEWTDRTLSLLGADALTRLTHQRVIVFGIGGVGSWCVEGLVRSGISDITIVDSDVVVPSNINRQLVATTSTVGMPKVEVMRHRIMDINPAARVTAIQQTFCAATADDFHLDTYDYIIDAIDSLDDKALLIQMSARTHAKVFSSMGAARKTDPSRIQVAEFWKVKGDPLARALRNRFRRAKTFPASKVYCVFSDEPPSSATMDGGAQPLGSIVHVTAAFGFRLAALVVNDNSNHAS